ncbi:MAG: metallophosphoesterase family protein [Betaproteobacteria bacterium]|nr:metallophosphoesterase family protein [Betaproteobacteria bacterium]
MKICIVSDSHDRAPALVAAVASAKMEGAEAVLHCGDIIGANTLRAAMELDVPLHVVHGNNLGDPLALAHLGATSGGLLHYYGADARFDLAGRRIFVTHLPEHGRAHACTGDFDLVCCGHTHEAMVSEQANIAGGKTWLLNPGTVAGIGAPATWMLADLAGMRFEIRRLA